MSKLPSPKTGELVDSDPRRFVSLRIRQLLVNGESPLEFLLKQMQDENNSVQFRAYCATQCLNYVHPRAAPEDIDVTDPHQRFLDHVEGLKAQLMSRLVRELPNTPEESHPEENIEAEIISLPPVDKKLPRKKSEKEHSQKEHSQKEPVE